MLTRISLVLIFTLISSLSHAAAYQYSAPRAVEYYKIIDPNISYKWMSSHASRLRKIDRHAPGLRALISNRPSFYDEHNSHYIPTLGDVGQLLFRYNNPFRGELFLIEVGGSLLLIDSRGVTKSSGDEFDAYNDQFSALSTLGFTLGQSTRSDVIRALTLNNAQFDSDLVYNNVRELSFIEITNYSKFPSIGGAWPAKAMLSFLGDTLIEVELSYVAPIDKKIKDMLEAAYGRSVATRRMGAFEYTDYWLSSDYLISVKNGREDTDKAGQNFLTYRHNGYYSELAPILSAKKSSGGGITAISERENNLKNARSRLPAAPY